MGHSWPLKQDGEDRKTKSLAVRCKGYNLFILLGWWPGQIKWSRPQYHAMTTLTNAVTSLTNKPEWWPAWWWWEDERLKLLRHVNRCFLKAVFFQGFFLFRRLFLHEFPWKQEDFHQGRNVLKFSLTASSFSLLTHIGIWNMLCAHACQSHGPESTDSETKPAPVPARGPEHTCQLFPRLYPPTFGVKTDFVRCTYEHSFNPLNHKQFLVILLMFLFFLVS